MFLSSSLLDSRPQKRMQYITCYFEIDRVVCLYKQIQQRLFNRINDLLAVKVPTIALADLADLLTEVCICHI